MEDYFGIPTNVDNISISSLFSRAYYQIWNDWFRDENLQPSLNFSKGDGPDPAPSNLRRRGKRHDYFTSCLPWPAKDNGNPVLLPLGTTAPITGIDGDPPTFQIPGGGQNLGLIPSAGNNWTFGGPDTSLGPSEWNNTGLEADLSNATSATINEIRQAFQVQRLQERDARGGTRYVEILKAHFEFQPRFQAPESGAAIDRANNGKYKPRRPNHTNRHSPRSYTSRNPGCLWHVLYERSRLYQIIRRTYDNNRSRSIPSRSKLPTGHQPDVHQENQI